MSRKKRGIGFKISGILLVILISAAGAGWFLLKDKLAIERIGRELWKETYTYKLDYSITGDDFIPGLEDYAKGSIQGTKGSQVLYGQVYQGETEGFGFYYDYADKTMIDIKPFFTGAIEKLDQSLGGGLLSRLIRIDDLYVSTGQIEYVTGRKPISLKDMGITDEMLQELSGKSGRIRAAMQMKKVKDLPAEEKLLGEEADYYELKLEQQEIVLRLGVPADRKEKRISAEIIAGGQTWCFCGEYSLIEEDSVVMPEETLNEEQLKIVKTIYSYWMEWKGKENS